MSATTSLSERAASFKAAVEEFATRFEQHQGLFDHTQVFLQSRRATIFETSDFPLILTGLTRFRATDLYWVKPVQMLPDGQHYCVFDLVFIAPEKEASHGKDAE